jgi:hypothetical protein
MRVPANKNDIKGMYENIADHLFKSSAPSHVIGYLADLMKMAKEQKTTNGKIVGADMEFNTITIRLDQSVSGTKTGERCIFVKPTTQGK